VEWPPPPGTGAICVAADEPTLVADRGPIQHIDERGGEDDNLNGTVDNDHDGTPDDDHDGTAPDGRSGHEFGDPGHHPHDVSAEPHDVRPYPWPAPGGNLPPVEVPPGQAAAYGPPSAACSDVAEGGAVSFRLRWS
jgi:hypothetical protein